MRRSSSHEEKPVWTEPRVVMSFTKCTITRILISTVLFSVFVFVLVGKAESKRVENEKKLRVEYYRNAYYTAIDDMRVVKTLTKWEEEQIASKATERVSKVKQYIGVSK